MDERSIDIFAMIHEGSSVAGQEALSNLPRLASLLASTAGTLRWTAQGRVEGDPRTGTRLYLVLEAQARPALPCGKCLEPVEVELVVARRLLVVADEAMAAELDEQEMEIDVIAGSRHFDLLALLEDEAILALPPLAAHEDCAPPGLGADDGEEHAGPLAGLAAFKRGGPVRPQ